MQQAGLTPGDFVPAVPWTELSSTLRLAAGGDVIDSLPSGGGGDVMSEVWMVLPTYLED